MSDALALVKEHFGADAIIVSTQSNGDDGVRVTAAVDEDPAPPAAVEPDYESRQDPLDVISEALNYHNVPAALADSLVDAAATSTSADPVVAMTTALDRVFRFAAAPLASAVGPVSLVGLPGAGKTVTVAKLATEAVVSGQPAAVITTDTVRAGGVEQLAAFTNILKIDLLRADDPARLRDALAAAGAQRPILVDNAGANPFDPDEFDRQQSFCQALDSAPHLVMAAGGDTGEAAEMADAFKELGVRGLIATRLDIARRIGAVLTAAATGDFDLLAFTADASVAEPPRPFNAVALARILLPDDYVRDAAPAPAPLWQSRRPA